MTSTTLPHLPASLAPATDRERRTAAIEESPGAATAA